MSLVVCKTVICSECKTPHLKNPYCLGDYTVDGKLLSFCPICGRMLPYLEETFYHVEKLSKTQKKQIGIKVAKRHNLDYKTMGSIVKQLPEDKERFVEDLCFRVKIEFGVEIGLLD